MGKSGCLIRLIIQIRKYLVVQIGQITRQIWFDLWFAQFILLVCDSYFTNHRQINQIGQILQIRESIIVRFSQIYIGTFVIFGHIWHTNQTNWTSQIIWFVIWLIHLRVQFDSLLFNLANLLIRFDLRSKFCWLAHH